MLDVDDRAGSAIVTKRYNNKTTERIICSYLLSLLVTYLPTGVS